MKRKNENQKVNGDFEKLQKLLENKLESIENQFQKMEHSQKVIDQKNLDAFRELSFRIVAEGTSTRQSLERTLRAEIQVANSELKNELKNEFRNELNKVETSLNKRLTHVADLITIQLGNKIQNHEKRISKLERTPQTA